MEIMVTVGKPWVNRTPKATKDANSHDVNRSQQESR
jgi:hypothetical protein